MKDFENLFNDESCSENEKAKIKVIAVGGSGTMVANLLEGQKNIDVYLINSDSASLKKSKVQNKILIGNIGLGCGGNIERAKEYAKSSINEFKDILKDTDVVFITTGLGGGTGSAIAPIIAKLAKDLGILSISIVTKPFAVEGKERIENANIGVKELKKYTGALIVVPNDTILPLMDSKSEYEKGFEMVDDIIRIMIESVVDMLTKQNPINIDFADIRNIIDDSKEVFLAIGGGNNIEEAFDNAIKDNFTENEKNILDANKIIMNIEYADEKDLYIGDIRKIYDKVHTMFNFFKSFKMGHNKNNNLVSKIKVTILASIK